MSFPTEFPRQQMANIILAIRGTLVPTKQLVEDGYDVVGYALAMSFTSPLIVAAVPGDVDGKAALLEKTMLSTGMSLPWKTIANIVLDLLKQFLSS